MVQPHPSRPPVPVPVFWRDSVVRSFVEVPVAGARFRAVELQQIEVDTKVGHTVVVHRAPGELELYVESADTVDWSFLSRDPAFAHFDVVHLQVLDGGLTPGTTGAGSVRCTLVGGDLDAAASFTDATGAWVEIKAKHRFRRRPRPLFTPAPPQPQPRNLRFLVVNDLRLLPGPGAEVSVTVDGTPAAVKPILVPPAGRAVAPLLETRSASEMVLAALVPDHADRRLDTAELGHNDLADGTVAEINLNGVRSVRTANDHGHLSVWFDPPLPGLDEWDDPDSHPPTTHGELKVDSAVGTVATGRWRLTNAGDGAAELVLDDLVQDWFPGWNQPVRLALRQVRNRRRRHQDWRYRAQLWRDDDGRWYSTGAWHPS